MKKAETIPNRMGEVRTKVRLLNVADASAAAAGKLNPDQVRWIEADALVDTGAVRSCVPAPLLHQLGVQPYDQQMVEYADGRKESVALADGVRFEILNRRSSDDALVLGDEVLIGQTLLEKMDLLVDCVNRRLIPNPAHPDVAVNKLK
jgi:clan AA aspartic protease